MENSVEKSVSSKCSSDLSMKEFLDFFHTAYQLNKMVDHHGIENSSSDISLNQSVLEINWDQLVQSKQLQEQEEEQVVSEEQSPNQNNWGGSERRRLHQLLQEGLLDSVLPYLVPKHTSTSTSSKRTHCTDSSSKLATRLVTPQERPRRNKQQQNQTQHRTSIKPDVEVEIHVCDEVKGLKRTFRCPQRLLVSEMGYFAEVTAGQRLEDMDISVHCDVANFEWLMQWVKRDQNMIESWPKLDCSNVVAVLTSAAFLQMDLLLENCLQFCYTKANEVLAGPANLACLNDSVLTRLAGMFSNAEVEQLRDRRDRLQGRLYCKLLAALAEPTPEETRGHYASLARIFKCNSCSKVVPGYSFLAARLPCAPANTKLGRRGHVKHAHVRSSSWNLSEHVAGLKAELRSWRRVYWRLWGEAHWLICSRCGLPFPLVEAACCLQHPEPPQFLGPPPQRSCGKYTCCGVKVPRFSPIAYHTGCQYDRHIAEMSTEKERAVWSIFQAHQNLIIIPPPSNNKPAKITGQEVDDETWPGLKLDTPPPASSFLPSITWEPTAVTKRDHGALLRARVAPQQSSSSGPRPISSGGGSYVSCSSSSSGASGEECADEDEDESLQIQSCQPVRVTARPRTAAALQASSALPPRSVTAGRHWDLGLSTRCNQDDQREYEERAVRRLVGWLSRRCNTSGQGRLHSTPGPPLGGTFVALEREWRDTHLRVERAPTSSKHRARSSRLL